jgi:hypothetical protein
MPSRCPDCGAAVGMHHLYGCDREACPFCEGPLMCCGCLVSQLPEAVQRQYGYEVCFVPPTVWEPLLAGKRRLYPSPPRRAV